MSKISHFLHITNIPFQVKINLHLTEAFFDSFYLKLLIEEKNKKKKTKNKQQQKT